jgi:hypothetical protein
MVSMTRIDIAALQKAYAGKSVTSAAGRITGPASGHGLGRERRMRERETSAAPADAGAFSARRHVGVVPGQAVVHQHAIESCSWSCLRSASSA